MFRNLVLCGLLVIVGLGAVAAGADRFLLLGMAGLAALGVLATRGRSGS